MAALAPIALGIGAAASVIGTVGAISAGNRQARAQRQQQTLNRRRSQRQAVRQAQIQRAASLSSAVGVGADAGSGFRGGVGSISSRVGEGLGHSSQMSALSGIASRAGQRASMFSGISSIGGSLMNLGLAGGASINDFVPESMRPRQAPVPNLTSPAVQRGQAVPR